MMALLSLSVTGCEDDQSEEDLGGGQVLLPSLTGGETEASDGSSQT